MTNTPLQFRRCKWQGALSWQRICSFTRDWKICQHWLTQMKCESIWLRSTLVRQWWTFSHNDVFHAQTAPNFWLYSTPKLSGQLQMLAKYCLHNSTCVFMTYKTIQRKTKETVFESVKQHSTFVKFHYLLSSNFKIPATTKRIIKNGKL